MTSAVAAPPESLEAVAAPVRAQSAASVEHGERVGQALVLAVVFAAPALMAVHAACAYDPDIWWHLRTGQWILEHHAVPRTDMYTSFAAGKPWAAYSWLFEAIFYKLFARMGLVGIVTYTAAMLLTITVALHHMIRRLHKDFSQGVLLTFAGCFAMSHLLTPRPWHFTILFFILELDILMHARRTGKLRELAWLPVIFALWANVHIQFVDGLIVLGIAAVEAVVAGRFVGRRMQLPAVWGMGALVASATATLVNPYGWHIYKIAYELASQPGVLNKINELQALPFRDLGDYLVLGIALASAAVLARMRYFAVFEVLLFGFAAFTSFRSQRDVWVMVAAGCAILAAGLPANDKARIKLGVGWTPLVAAVSALVVAIGFPAMHVTNEGLQLAVAREMPVAAVDFAKARGVTGPVYNDFVWGGYLIWALRQPVSIDGRAALDGDARIERSGITWNGEPEWAGDPDLMPASMVIGRAKAPLTQLLRGDARFQLVYEDKLAVVFVPKGR